MPNWLWNGAIPENVPLFISRRRLVARCKRPKHRAKMDWCLDSGGFTELSQFGRWTITPKQYVDEIRFYREKLGRLVWAAPMDHMCEPWILKKTGRSLRDHLVSTVENFLELRHLAPDLPIIPVLQGWRLDDYLQCREMYEAAGVKLEDFETVGLGSVCRRQGMAEAADIIRALQPIQLHGFGFKIDGIKAVGHLLTSADSMSWSLDARMRGKGNDPAEALRWRQKITQIDKPAATLADLFSWGSQ